VANPDFDTSIDFFPYGTQYHRAPTPLPDEWEGDLAEIARIGYTHVQFRPQWIWHERIRGHYTWDDLDRLFDLAHQNGLRVVLKPMIECAPDWVYEDLGGARIGFHGHPLGPNGHGAFYAGGWLPCFDNPDVIKAGCEFVKALVSRYKSHPALWFYDSWNEPRSKPAGQCRCPHSVADYRGWLKRKYGTIEAMNEALGKAWVSFDTIHPPDEAWDYIQLFLWRQWAAEAVSHHVEAVYDAIKEVDPDSSVLLHVGMCSVCQDAVWDSSDDLLNAQHCDRYGTSFPVDLYPRTPVGNSGSDFIGDWLRRVDPRFWIHEFYTNYGEWNRPPDPLVLNRLLWLALSGGTSGFTFWQYRSERLGNETAGWGMRNIDGTSTARSDVAEAIAGILREHGSKLVGTSRPTGRTAVLYSRKSDLINRITEIEPGELQTYGNQIEHANSDYSAKRAVRNAHAMLLAMGETAEYAVPGDDLAGCELLVVSCAEMIDSAAADWLRDYVRAGGRLLVETPFACRDENTWVSRKRPSNCLYDLLGCVESDRVVANGADVARFEDGTELTAKGWRVEFQPTTGQTIATWENGTVAAIRNSYGKGEVIALSINLSLTFEDKFDDPAMKMFQSLADEMLGGTVERKAVAESGVWVRRRVDGDKQIWFVFNLTDSARQFTLPNAPLEIWQEAGCSVSDLELTLPPKATFVAQMS
jgi:beta-galactosidase GanA